MFADDKFNGEGSYHSDGTITKGIFGNNILETELESLTIDQ